MAACRMLIGATTFLVLIHSCFSFFVEEPKKISLDILIHCMPPWNESVFPLSNLNNASNYSIA